MKVIFLQNIEGNNVGDVKDVADGYARNYLLKNGLAVVATPEEIERIEKRIEKLKKEEETTIKSLEEKAKKMEGLVITLRAEAGPEEEEGRRKLFGSIANHDIQEVLQEKGYDIDKKDIEIPEQIKELGEYAVTIKFGHNVQTEIKIKVEANK